MLLKQLVNLCAEPRGVFICAVARLEIEERGAVASFFDQGQVCG